MNQCPFCAREFSNPGGLATHSPYCKDNPNRKQRPQRGGLQKGQSNWDGTWLGCSFCERKFKNKGGVKTHEPYCRQNPDRVEFVHRGNVGRKKGCTSWNKGLSGDPRCARPDAKGKKFGSSLGGHSEATKAKLSEIAKRRGLGGYVRGSGRGQKGWYQGHWCDSSWELAWIIYQLDHGVWFKRNTTKFPYQYEGKEKHWIPDFILEDGTYVEIKGYETEQVRAKLADFNQPIILLKEKNLTPVFEYVIQKYGKEFTSLYEDK